MSNRRQFLQTIAAMAAAGTMPPSIARALALPANRRTGSIKDVEHIVILTQENRSFDHYFGTLRGVRGYGDPRPMMLPSGDSVFHQPHLGGERAVLPFHMDSFSTSGPLIKSLDHSWKGDAAEWSNYDVWIKHKTPLSMGHFRRHDIAYYHALADAFTIGDGYYSSIHGPTNPNRMYLFTGTSGLTVGNHGTQAVENADDGNWTGDAAKDKPDFVGAGWTTYAERLQSADISWRLYQEHDNFGDNSLAYFKAFRGLLPSNVLHRRGRAVVAGSNADNSGTSDASHLVAAFAADVAAGTLPQVSWIVAPTKYSEHPKAPPAYGESLTARLLDALTEYPDTWSKTAFILNYDENDGFFDHMPAPLPAVGTTRGKSTIDTHGETYQGQAVGLGVRVPLIIVSPWSRGGWVNSEVFDHTSVIRFIEQRFGVAEPNISPWRRAVTGDLTSMFDFAQPDAAAMRGFPKTSDYVALVAASSTMPLPTVPSSQTLPKQEPGQRSARALPYRLSMTARSSEEGLTFDFVNQGKAAAVFNVYCYCGGSGPWFFTLGAGERFRERLEGFATSGPYSLAAHGPNGFLREFAGDLSADNRIEAELAYTPGGDMVLVRLVNRGSTAVSVAVRALAYTVVLQGKHELAPAASISIRYPVAANDHWYDLIVEIPGTSWMRRFAGHVETGKPSRSDPAIGKEIKA